MCFLEQRLVGLGPWVLIRSEIGVIYFERTFELLDVFVVHVQLIWVVVRRTWLLFAQFDSILNLFNLTRTDDLSMDLRRVL